MTDAKPDQEGSAGIVLEQKAAKPAVRRKRRWPIIIIGGLLALFIFGGVGFVSASLLEEHDTFCIACHTTPETTYYNRTQAALNNPSTTIPDLASAHYHLTQVKNQSFACINCHRGDSTLSNRIETLALGGRDAVIFVSGKADPAIEKTTIYQAQLPNAACVSCHMDTMLTVKGLDSHYHNYLPQTAQLIAEGYKPVFSAGHGRGKLRAVRNTSVVCTSCHLAHETTNDASNLKFVDTAVVQKACDTCHNDDGDDLHSIDELFGQ